MMTLIIHRVFTVHERFDGFFYHPNDIFILFKYISSKATAFQLIELKMIILIAHTINPHTQELELLAMNF